MVSRTLAGSLALEGDWNLGEDNWKDGMDENLLKLSALAQAVALDFVSATPGAPDEGDVYLFDSTHPTHPNAIALYDEGVWSYLDPVIGWLVYDTAGETMRMFDGVIWGEFSSGGGGSGGGGGIVVTAPVLVQKGFNRNGGTLSLPVPVTIGNLMVILAAGFSSATAYKPADFQLIGQFQSDANNRVYCWAKRAISGDTGSYTGIAMTDDKQAVIYEFESSDGVLPIAGGAMPTWSGTSFSQTLLPHPLAPKAINLFAMETDTAVPITVTPETGWTLDYATPAATSTNHYAAIGHIGVGFDGILSGTSSSGPTQPVFGFFGVLGASSGSSGGTGAWSVTFRPIDNEAPGSNYATINTRNYRPVLEFDDTTQESAIFSGVIPAGYSGDGLSVTLVVAAKTATSGTIGWDIALERTDASSLDIDTDSFASAVTMTAQSVPATSGQVLYVDVDLASGTEIDDLAAGDLFRIRIRRDVANDTAVGDTQLLAVLIKEQ